MTARPICNSGRFAHRERTEPRFATRSKGGNGCVGVVDGARDNLLVKVCLAVNI